MRNCEKCGEPIPTERLEILPSTTTCVKCSQTGRQMGFMVGTAAKGCAATIIMIPQNNPEALRQARNAHLRKR